jgi:hypothetical protein
MLHRIMLRLARTPKFPNGSAGHGYDIVAPLDRNGRLDAEAWAKARAACTVEHFTAGAPTRQGRLIHRPGGRGGATWVIDYDAGRTGDDEAGFRLDVHRFVSDDFITLIDRNGPQTYRIVSVDPVTPDA